jgi:hypothetical protein
MCHPVSLPTSFHTKLGTTFMSATSRPSPFLAAGHALAYQWDFFQTKRLDGQYPESLS